MRTGYKKIPQARLEDIVDPTIKEIEEIKTGIKVIPGRKCGFSLTPTFVLLWYQEGADVIRHKFWYRSQVKITESQSE